MKYFLHFVFMALMPLATIHCQILTKSFVLRLSDMAQVIEEQKKVIEDQNTSNDILKTKVDDLDQELDNLQIRINNLENPQSVFFRVAITAPTPTVNSNTIIPWTTVFDNIGNGYDNITHRFTAPRSGTYQFTATVMNPEGTNDTYIYLGIRSDYDTLCNALVVYDKHQSATCSRVVQLEQGHRVWAMNPAPHTAQYHGNGYTTFSGVLLY